MQLIPTSGSTLNPSERRRYARYAVRCRCWLEGSQASVFAHTVDVGLGGLFLRTAVPVPAGETVTVTLELTDGEPLIAEAIVSRRVQPLLGHRPGIGVELVHIARGRMQLERLLRAR